MSNAAGFCASRASASGSPTRFSVDSMRRSCTGPRGRRHNPVSTGAFIGGAPRVGTSTESDIHGRLWKTRVYAISAGQARAFRVVHVRSTGFPQGCPQLGKSVNRRFPVVTACRSSNRRGLTPRGTSRWRRAERRSRRRPSPSRARRATGSSAPAGCSRRADLSCRGKPTPHR